MLDLYSGAQDYLLMSFSMYSPRQVHGCPFLKAMLSPTPRRGHPMLPGGRSRALYLFSVPFKPQAVTRAASARKNSKTRHSQKRYLHLLSPSPSPFLQEEGSCIKRHHAGKCWWMAASSRVTGTTRFLPKYQMRIAYRKCLIKDSLVTGSRSSSANGEVVLVTGTRQSAEF